MTILTLPDHRFSSVNWSLIQPTQVNRSEWTGRRQVMQLPGAAYWRVQAEHVPIFNEADFRPWRAFLASMRGQVNKARFKATGFDQHSGSNPVVASGAPGGFQMSLTGMPPSALFLPAGSYLTVIFASAAGEQLVMLTQDLVANGAGAGTATFESMLRLSAVGGTIESKRPWCLIAFDDPSTGYTVDGGWKYGFSLAGTEAF